MKTNGIQWTKSVRFKLNSCHVVIEDSNDLQCKLQETENGLQKKYYFSSNPVCNESK